MSAWRLTEVMWMWYLIRCDQCENDCQWWRRRLRSSLFFPLISLCFLQLLVYSSSSLKVRRIDPAIEPLLPSLPSSSNQISVFKNTLFISSSSSSKKQFQQISQRVLWLFFPFIDVAISRFVAVFSTRQFDLGNSMWLNQGQMTTFENTFPLICLKSLGESESEEKSISVRRMKSSSRF